MNYFKLLPVLLFVGCMRFIRPEPIERYHKDAYEVSITSIYNSDQEAPIIYNGSISIYENEDKDVIWIKIDNSDTR